MSENTFRRTFIIYRHMTIIVQLKVTISGCSKSLDDSSLNVANDANPCYEYPLSLSVIQSAWSSWASSAEYESVGQ
jgi:hypothetical protein